MRKIHIGAERQTQAADDAPRSHKRHSGRAKPTRARANDTTGGDARVSYVGGGRRDKAKLYSVTSTKSQGIRQVTPRARPQRKFKSAPIARRIWLTRAATIMNDPPESLSTRVHGDREPRRPNSASTPQLAASHKPQFATRAEDTRGGVGERCKVGGGTRDNPEIAIVWRTRSPTAHPSTPRETKNQIRPRTAKTAAGGSAPCTPHRRP
ncbi:hypothetical protein B0H16DRAFT_1475318 [Mycena metata]|uniref:Uncharacterized protein n=1 Tax=Mycena metata TaxID=1033252 RepID=A0AAD7HF60_9AGAR|nr:hypothetical protein B0H16DRAFT_1475318 [Mycena metata]